MSDGSSDGSALLAAVLRAPDDDTPRLIYADWLEEHGQEERAEFIRLQVWLAVSQRLGHRSRTASRRRAAKGLRSVELLQQVAEWAPGVFGGGHVSSLEELKAGTLVALLEDVDGYVEFRRGFVDAVNCPADWWLRHADAVLAAHPVRRVVLTTWLSGGEVDGAFYRLAAEDGQEATVRNCRRVAPPADVLPAGLYACTRWLLEREWPGVAFELPELTGAAGRLAIGGVQVGVTAWRLLPGRTLPPVGPPAAPPPGVAVETTWTLEGEWTGGPR